MPITATPRVWTAYPSPFTTTPNTDASLNFEALEALPFLISGLRIVNNSAVNVYYAYDSVASLGSAFVAPGVTYFNDEMALAVLHIYTPSPVSVNGTTPGGIEILGVLNI